VSEIHDLCRQLTDHPRAQNAWIALQAYRTRALRIAGLPLSLEEKEARIEAERGVLKEQLRRLLSVN
jgi:hypothetical protein